MNPDESLTLAQRSPALQRWRQHRILTRQTAHYIMHHMKEFNVRHVQHNLASLLEAVEQGERVHITRRGKVVAQLAPPESFHDQLSWPDVSGRFARLAPLLKHGVPASTLISEDRKERF